MSTVIPSHLSVVDAEDPPGEQPFDNVSLRLGEVVGIIYPDDKQHSRTRRFIEYRVAVQHLDRYNGTGGETIYPNCVLGNLFGGRADRSRFTLRFDTERKEGLGLGSKVLLGCINGLHTDPVILMGLRDETDSDEGAKEQGHHLTSIFNGVQLGVDKDGQLIVLRAGPTDLKGELQDGVEKETVGSGIRLETSGDLVAHTGDDRESIRLKRADQTVEIKAPSGIRVGDATDRQLLGETYRNDESLMNNQATGALTQAIAAVASAGVSLKSLAVLHLIPIIGPIIGAPAVGAVAVQFDVLAQALTQLQSAIQEFEQKAKNHLSRNNLSD